MGKCARLECGRSWASVLVSSVVNRGFIGGVMVIGFASSVVDRGFIGGVMVIVFSSSEVDRGFELRSAQT